MALRVQYLEIILQIGQHFVSIEQGDYFVPTQPMLPSILLDAERKEIGDIEFFIFHALCFRGAKYTIFIVIIASYVFYKYFHVEGISLFKGL